MDATLKVTAARTSVRHKVPYFNALISGLAYRWVPAGTLWTMGITDSGVVLLDPAFIEQCSVSQLAFALLHEGAGHFLRAHAERRPEGADRRLWNIAGDLEINDDLVHLGFQAPDGIVTPERFGLPSGKLAEEYYAILRAASEDEQVEQSGNAPGCSKGWCGSGAGRPLPDEPKDTDGSTGGHSHEGEAASGSSDGGPGGEGEGGYARTPSEIARIRQQVAADIQAHEATAKGRGTVPGMWKVWAGQTLTPPRVNWRVQLARATRTACAYRPGAVTTTYRKLGRRQAAVGYGSGKPRVAAWHTPVPRVAVIVDTSGSMSRSAMASALSEVDGILKSLQASIDFCVCDSDVHGAVKPVQSVRDAVDRLTGGGGTDFRPAINAVLRSRAGKPEIIIIATDGDGPAPSVAPAAQIIWLLVGSHRTRPWTDSGGKINYGTFIDVEEDNNG